MHLITSSNIAVITSHFCVTLLKSFTVDCTLCCCQYEDSKIEQVMTAVHHLFGLFFLILLLLLDHRSLHSNDTEGKIGYSGGRNL